jgi:hypothetical protein
MPAAVRRNADYDTASTDYIEDDDFFTEDSEDISAARSSAIQSGWESALQKANSSSNYTNEFKFTEDSQLVKFQSAEPIGVYDQHWVTRDGKRSWVCLGEGCPLCAIGDRPAPRFAFAVVNLSAEEPVAELLSVSSKTMRIIRRLHEDPVTGPLDRLYFALSRSGKGSSAVFSFVPVKPRDLEEDWGLPASDAEAIISAIDPLDSTSVPFSPKAKLAEVAREFSPKDRGSSF